MATRDANERRLRLGVWAGFRLPDLGLEPGDPVERSLETVYHDTADLRLLRRGVTVREEREGWSVRRTVGENGTAAEAVLMAGGDDDGAAPAGRRRGAGHVPAAIEAVTVAWRLGEPLVAVARLATRRRDVALRDGAREVARLSDDEVSLLRGERVAARFRELELALLDGAGARVLDGLGRRLREAGAQPIDTVPKLVRGLAGGALEPAPPAAPDAGPGATAEEAIRARLSRSLATWVDHHAALLLEGGAVDLRAVRSAARTLRRDLRVLAPAVDARAGLGRFVDALTPARRLDRLLELEPPPGGDELRAWLAAERAAALDGARAELRAPRYAALLRDVAGVAERPPLPPKAAARPAAELLPRLARDPLQRVRRASAEDPERLRKLVDRLHTAVDAAAPFADAAHAAAELAELRGLLREHHRSCTAIAALEAIAARAPEHGWAAGILAGREGVRAAAAAEALPYALQRATRRKLWAWIP